MFLMVVRMSAKKQEGDPLLVRLPPIKMDDGKDKQPKDRCGECGRPVVAATIDRGGTIKIIKRPVGRPKKGSKWTRRKRVGKWCDRCGLFYYPNGSPNYKTRNAK